MEEKKLNIESQKNKLINQIETVNSLNQIEAWKNQQLSNQQMQNQNNENMLQMMAYQMQMMAAQNQRNNNLNQN